MLRIVQRFGKHCNCHLQSEYVVAGCFWKPYIGQAVCGELDLMVLIGGAEERDEPNHYTFTLKMVTAMSAETLDNSQHSTRLIPESLSCTSFTMTALWGEMFGQVTEELVGGGRNQHKSVRGGETDQCLVKKLQEVDKFNSTDADIQNT
jgi:hypothetical protein